MPVTGNRPPVAPNKRGQLVNRASNFNPRGVGKPRPRSAVMPDRQQKNKGKIDPDELNAPELQRIQSLRRKLLSNNRNDKGPNSRGDKRITPAEHERLMGLRRKLSRDNDPPSLKEFLGSDITYQHQLADLKNNLQNYLEMNKGERQDVREAFGTARGKMDDARDQAWELMGNDFAGRGLLHSGLYTKSLSDYDRDWIKRLNELRDDRGEQLEDLSDNRKLFRDEVRSTRRNARLDAVRRRAERYSL